jgi:hypothetical protein
MSHIFLSLDFFKYSGVVAMNPDSSGSSKIDEICPPDENFKDSKSSLTIAMCFGESSNKIVVCFGQIGLNISYNQRNLCF